LLGSLAALPMLTGSAVATINNEEGTVVGGSGGSGGTGGAGGETGGGGALASEDNAE
jgi:hypothetical protein